MSSFKDFINPFSAIFVVMPSINKYPAKIFSKVGKVGASFALSSTNKPDKKFQYLSSNHSLDSMNSSHDKIVSFLDYRTESTMENLYRTIKSIKSFFHGSERNP